jgi:hypothetical protein
VLPRPFCKNQPTLHLQFTAILNPPYKTLENNITTYASSNQIHASKATFRRIPIHACSSHKSNSLANTSNNTSRETHSLIINLSNTQTPKSCRQQNTQSSSHELQLRHDNLSSLSSPRRDVTSEFRMYASRIPNPESRREDE